MARKGLGRTFDSLIGINDIPETTAATPADELVVSDEKRIESLRSKIEKEVKGDEVKEIDITDIDEEGVGSVANITVLSADLKSSSTYVVNTYTEGYLTGIANVEGDSNEVEAIYNLNGQRVDSPVKGQVYITKYANGKTVGICGQGPSVYPEFTEFLVREGIDYVSLNPDTVVKTKKMIASVEQKIILEGLRDLRSRQ